MARRSRLISEFFVALNENPELKKLYVKEPASAYIKFGLDAEQQRILETRSLKEIQDAIRAEYAEAAKSSVLVMYVMHISWPSMHIALPRADDREGPKS